MVVRSTKLDGSLHYRYNARPVALTQESARLYLPPGEPVQSYRGDQVSKNHVLLVFWPDRHWNLHLSWRPDRSLRHYYVNIATPASWSAGEVTWVDLDLDVIWRPGQEPHLDDEDEFADHRLRFRYPEDLVARCHDAVSEVREAMNERAGVFDGSLEGWLASARG